MGLLLAIVVGVVAFALLWRALGAKNRSNKLTRVATTSAVVLGVVLLLLTATGRLHWLAAIAAGSLPFLRLAAGLVAGPLISNLLQRGFRRHSMFGSGQQSVGADPRQSAVQTDDLRMTLDHESGEMDGEVLTGPLAGRRLSELDLATLQGLYRELSATDSKQLLAAYLQRRFPDWNEGEPQERAQTAANGEMDREQALAVLGLDAGASAEQVVDAHRRLMQKLHPDRGGTDFLAATLNRAKEVLLG